MSREERRNGQRDGRRSRPYARVYVTAKNHHRTADIYSDNDLWATYVRILVEATERHADHTDDQMLVAVSELGALTGKRRTDISLKLLGSLAEVGVISVERRRNVCSIGVRNFAKRQGFGSIRATHVVPSPAPAPAPSIEDPRSPHEVGASDRDGSDGKFNLTPPEDVDPKRRKADSRRAKKIRGRAKSEELAKSVWPELVERAASHGRSWAPVPHKDQLRMLVGRIEEGATRQQLLDAIDGFVVLTDPGKIRSDGISMMKYLRATTIFAPTKFRDYLEAAATVRPAKKNSNWVNIEASKALERERLLREQELGDELPE